MAIIDFIDCLGMGGKLKKKKGSWQQEKAREKQNSVSGKGFISKLDYSFKYELTALD